MFFITTTLRTSGIRTFAVKIQELGIIGKRMEGITLFCCVSTLSIARLRMMLPMNTDQVQSFSTIPTGTTSDRVVKKSNLYTRTGDKGTSSLYSGERRAKTDPIFEALGDTDELNACIGIAREHCELVNNGLHLKLAEIQSRLFDLGANIATPSTSTESKKAITEFPAVHTFQLEKWIDEVDSTLPPLKNFVIPSGSLCSTHLNLARAVCRRAERKIVYLVQQDQASEEAAKYLNRLSDFLFACSRYAAVHGGHTEILWKKA